MEAAEAEGLQRVMEVTLYGPDWSFGGATVLDCRK